MKRLVITLLVLFLAACASTGQKQKVVAAYQSAEIALGQFQDAEIAAYNAKVSPTLTEEKHRAVAAALSKAFDAQIKVGTALQLWESGKPAPIAVSEWVSEAERVVAAVRLELPDNAQLKLVEAILPWVRAVVQTAQFLGVSVPPTLQSAAEGKV